MAKNKESNPIKAIDTIKLGGIEYSLKFEFGAVADVEEELDKSLITGLDGNMINKPKISLVQTMLYTLLKPNKPDITFAEVKGLVTPHNIGAVWSAVIQTWVAALSTPTEETGTEKND